MFIIVNKIYRRIQIYIYNFSFNLLKLENYEIYIRYINILTFLFKDFGKSDHSKFFGQKLYKLGLVKKVEGYER